MALDSAKVDIAYKYPFSSEAKEVVAQQQNQIKSKYLEMAGKQIEQSGTESANYTEISIGSVKIDYVMSYLYSRMLLSAI